MIRVGPFAWEPVPTALGLALLAEPHDPGAPIAQLADLARRDPELQAALAAGVSWSRYPAAVEFPVGPEDEARMRASWQDASGEAFHDTPMIRLVTAAGATLGVPRAAFLAAVEELMRRDRAWVPEPGPWLFRRDPMRPAASSDEPARMKALELRACALDAALSTTGGYEPDSVPVDRRALLADLRDAGLFEREHGELRRNLLRSWRYPTLLALAESARELRELYPDAPDVLDLPVTLDALRLFAPRTDRGAWIRAGVELVPDAAPGDQGTTLRQQGGSWVTMRWRRDGARPALLTWGPGRR